MKLTDEVRNAAKQASFRYSFEPKRGRDFMQGFEEGATWARDKACEWVYLSQDNAPTMNRCKELSEGTYVIQTVYGDMCLTNYKPRLDCFTLLNEPISAIPGNEVYACLPIEPPKSE